LNLKQLKDSELLSQTKQLVQKERQVLTQILNHIREVERRKLFSDLGYQSLFEYAIKELQYSEGQAGRRIQAMRLIKEIPEIEKKIESGKLSLSNISQAQSYFREIKKMNTNQKLRSSEAVEIKMKFEAEDKLKILESLENKSVREGQKILIQMQPQIALTKEKERALTESHSEMRFILTEKVKKRLEELRSLLGVKGTNMSFADLVDYMVGVSLHDLKLKKFGKKRTLIETTTPTSELQHSKNLRYVSRAVQLQVWNRDQGKCTNCGNQRNLNIDHIKPLALGGKSNSENLRLLCFHCNQRQAIMVFGVNHVQRKQRKEKYDFLNI
jgi:hypothetical protein